MENPISVFFNKDFGGISHICPSQFVDSQYLSHEKRTVHKNIIDCLDCVINVLYTHLMRTVYHE